MIFGERLKLLRKNRHLTQKVLAEAIGIAERHYQGLEYGKTNPGLDIVMTLADYFNVSIDYLVGHSDEPQPMKHQAENDGKEAEILDDSELEPFFAALSAAQSSRQTSHEKRVRASMLLKAAISALKEAEDAAYDEAEDAQNKQENRQKLYGVAG